MFSLCAIIPVFNHNPTSVVAGLLARGISVVLVDDGSQGSFKEIQRDLVGSTVWLEEFPQNRGKGAAVMAGFRIARSRGFTHAVQIDADGQHDLSALTPLIATSRRFPTRLVLGVPVYDESVPKARFYGRKVSNFWARLETLNPRIGDVLCGFRIYPIEISLQVSERYRIAPRMAFDSDILVRILWEGVQIANVPVKVTYPPGGTSHFNMVRDNIAISFLFFTHFWRMIPRIPRLVKFRAHSIREWVGSCFSLRALPPFFGFLEKIGGYPLVESASLTSLPLLFIRERIRGVRFSLGDWARLATQQRVLVDRVLLYRAEAGVARLEWEGKGLLSDAIASKSGCIAILHGEGFADIVMSPLRHDYGNAVRFAMNPTQLNRTIFEEKLISSEGTLFLKNLSLEGVLLVKSHLSEGGLLCVSPNEFPLQRHHLDVTMGGESLRIPLDLFELAQIVSAPILLLAVERVSPLVYQVHCDSLTAATPRESAQMYAELVYQYEKSGPHHYSCNSFRR